MRNARDSAALLRRLRDTVETMQNESEQTGATQVLRTVEDTCVTDDSVSATVNNDPGWDWSGDSTFGFDSW